MGWVDHGASERAIFVVHETVRAQQVVELYKVGR